MEHKIVLENTVKSSRTLGTLAAAMLAVTAGSSALADDDSGWYIGANAGQSRAKIDDVRIIDGLAAQGIATTALKDDDRTLGYKVFGGYEFNQYLALESGYFDLGKFGYTAATAPPAGLT